MIFVSLRYKAIFFSSSEKCKKLLFFVCFFCLVIFFPLPADVSKSIQWKRSKTFSDGWWAPLDLNLTLQASNANTPSNSLWSSWPILCFYMSAVNTYHHCRNSVVYKDISPLKEFSNTFCLVTTLNKKGFCSVAWKEFQIVEHSMSEIPPLASHLLHSWKLQITNIC